MEVQFKEPKNLEEFHKLISENKKVAIDFHATWCGPCKLIAPKFKQYAASNPDITYAKIDVDDVADVAAEVAVRAMPTFVFYLDGQKFDEVVGANAAKLEEAIKKLASA
ncbi:thioredoxin [Lichtheimia ornata]|uniref:Thioredoxin n=1 Tax=Lichtheimia ornata TaxID=688661 RepID=A0AAD7US66_9FUNG|nr:thioredoxin [Lichtheimia ornata]KAJ8652156.1 thioredoxin [Lichtheimia ornata]